MRTPSQTRASCSDQPKAADVEAVSIPVSLDEPLEGCVYASTAGSSDVHEPSIFIRCPYLLCPYLHLIGSLHQQ